MVQERVSRTIFRFVSIISIRITIITVVLLCGCRLLLSWFWLGWWEWINEGLKIGIEYITLNRVLVNVHLPVELAVRFVRDVKLLDSTTQHLCIALYKFSRFSVQTFDLSNFQPNINTGQNRFELRNLTIKHVFNLLFHPFSNFLVTKFTVQNFHEKQGRNF